MVADFVVPVRYVIPVRYNDPQAPELLTKSIRETGFAVLTGHPLSHDLIRNTYSEWEKFFASERKHDSTFDVKSQAGYFPFRTEKAKGYSVSDLKEFYHYYPSRVTLPEGTKTYTPELYQKLSHLGAELLGWIDDNTPEEVRKNFSMPLRDMIVESKETLLRPIHYPPLNGSESDGAIRAAAHEDINLITLLPAATAPGLEVKDTRGQWHSVQCNPGEIVINAGDMLQMASRGYYVSTTHRVVNPSGPMARTSRFSMPLFLHPAAKVRLSEKHTALTYLRERLGEIGLL